MKLIGIFSVFCLFSQNGWTYATLGESGELTPPGILRVGVEPQFASAKEAAPISGSF